MPAVVMRGTSPDGSQLSLFIKGLAIGAANIIPGVSGGTLLWSLGLYPGLISALKSWDGQALRFLVTGRLKDFVAHTQIQWLGLLSLGMIVGLFGLAQVIETLLYLYPIPTYAFFFGLIAGSVALLIRGIQHLSWSTVLTFFLGLMIMPIMMQLTPTQADSGFLYLLFCGILAMTGMLVPGFSGSLLLILLGNYALIVGAITRFDTSILTPFVLGMAIGLISSARLIGWVLSRYPITAIAFITGLIVGSLPRLWPWRTESYFLPTDWNNPYTLIALVVMFVGLFFTCRTSMTKSG